MTDIDHIDHMIAVMQAAKEGKTIQFRVLDSSDIDVRWRDAHAPSWDWYTFDYRVKPAAPRRVWRNWYPKLERWAPAATCYDSREVAKSFAEDDTAEQIEFVEVVK